MVYERPSAPFVFGRARATAQTAMPHRGCTHCLPDVPAAMPRFFSTVPALIANQRSLCPPRARKREAAPLYGRHHLRYRVGRRSPHQIRRGAAQGPVSPTLHRAILLRRAILLPFSRPPAISRKGGLFVAERDGPLMTRSGP